MWLQGVFFGISMILTLLFFLYGFNQYYLVNKARLYRQPPPAPSPDDRPTVSIHLPIYNERYVVRRLVTACVQMAEAYGADRVRILVLDDSDDDTRREVDAVIGEYRKKRFHIDVLRRENRQGYKAGALQAGLEKTTEGFIAVFDADFTPPTDFLIQTMPYFAQDKNLGIIQTRWGHLNRDFNVQTKAVSLAIDAHFVIEQAGRYAAGLFQNFNGSGGVLRTQAIQDAGGWQADTLCEDLDLSYRMQLQGYRLLYLETPQSPGEIPPTLPSFKKQQARWACGSLRTARKIIPELLPNSKIGFKQRLQGLIHLTGYMIHPLMFFSFILTCLATFLNIGNHMPLKDILVPPAELRASIWNVVLFYLQNTTWILLGLLIVLCALAPWVSLISTLRMEKLPLTRNLSSLAILLLLGFGISISNTLEAGKALLSNRSWTFNRTPKYAELQSKSGWKAKRYQVALDPLWLLELTFACMGLFAIGFGIWQSNNFVLIILVPFTLAYFFVLSLTIQQSRKRKVSQRV